MGSQQDKSKEEKFKVRIQMWNCGEVEVEASKSSNRSDLLMQLKGYSFCETKFMFGNKELTNKNTLSDIGATANSLIVLVREENEEKYLEEPNKIS